jgi:hypothetical protein
MKSKKMPTDKQSKRDKEFFKAPRNGPGAESGSPSWCYQTIYLLKLYWESKNLSEKRWLNILGELKEQKVWDKIPPDNPYGSLDALLKAEVGVDEETISNGVAKTPQDGKDMPLREGPGGNVKTLHVDNVNMKDRPTGNSKSYLLRRMGRDFPEVLDKLEAGEYKSTRQAAIACGIVKVKTPLQKIEDELKKLSPGDIQILKTIIEQYEREK